MYNNSRLIDKIENLIISISQIVLNRKYMKLNRRTLIYLLLSANVIILSYLMRLKIILDKGKSYNNKKSKYLSTENDNDNTFTAISTIPEKTIDIDTNASSIENDDSNYDAALLISYLLLS